MGLMKDILSPGEIKRIPYLSYTVVEGLVKEHLTGQANHETKLWALINLVLWEQQRRRLRSQANDLGKV